LAEEALCGFHVQMVMLRWLSRAAMFPGAPAPRLPVEALAARGISLLDYRAADGLPLTGLWVRSAQPAAETLVYFHGNAEGAADNLPMAERLAARGRDVFLVEYRGYAGMPGSPSEHGLYHDAEGAIAALEVPDCRLVLVGRSLGSGVAVEMARRGRGKALVLISPYTSMVELARRMVGGLARVVVADQFDNASKIGTLTMPITVIHGQQDQVVPFAMGAALSRLARGARLVSLPHCGHNDIPDVAALIEDALASSSPSGA
jgi:fermentation-respiration switch protein FrsA (DUF1100 family)